MRVKDFSTQIQQQFQVCHSEFANLLHWWSDFFVKAVLFTFMTMENVHFGHSLDIFCPQSSAKFLWIWPDLKWQRLVSLNKSFLGFYKTCFSFNLLKYSEFWVYSICFLKCLLNLPSEKHSFSVDVLIIHHRIWNRNDEVQEVLSFATQEVQKITMTAVFCDHQHRTWKRAGKMTKIEQLLQENPAMTSFWCFYMVSSW